MNSNQLFESEKKSVMQTYGRFPVAISRGENATLFSPEGKPYIDFASGIGVNSVGTAHPKWVKAVSEQASALAHTSNLYYTEPGIVLAEKLCALSGMDKVFFANSGAEANEGMIKLARKYSFDKYGAGRASVITLVQSFHGRTITTLAATGQDKFHNYFFPFTEGFTYAEAGNLDAISALDDGTICAVMLETIQGEGGVLPLDPEYLKAVQALCKEKDWLLLIDEVQTGVGRTGHFFSYLEFELEPDVISFAKGIAGGLPFGGFLAASRVSATLGAGMHGSTFGMNAVCSAAALAVLEILINDGEMAKVAARAARIRAGVEALGYTVRGRGLMMGIPVENPAECVNKLLEAGLLALTAGNAIRFLPPLTITDSEIDKGLKIFAEVMKK